MSGSNAMSGTAQCRSVNETSVWYRKTANRNLLTRIFPCLPNELRRKPLTLKGQKLDIFLNGESKILKIKIYF